GWRSCNQGKTKENKIRMEPAAHSKLSKHLTIRELLKPHTASLLLGLLAVAGEGAANLLEPWPLKIVLDDVLRSRASHAWIMQRVHAFLGMYTFDVLICMRF